MAVSTPAPIPAAQERTHGGSRPVTVIEPPRPWVPLDLRELWEQRELIYFLAWRDLKVRYKQTALGASWAILQPVFAMVVFSIFFGQLGRIPSDGLPYPLWSFAGLVPWTFFAQGLSQAANSLVMSQNLLRKVYFPRLAIPIATVLSVALDFAIAFLVLVGLMMFYGVQPTGRAIWVLPLSLLAFVTALGAGIWFAALSVRYRDVRYIVPFLVQFWLFATPIAYPSSLLPAQWRVLYAVNPMSGVVEGFRWALLGTNTAPGLMVAVSAITAIVVLVAGAFYFRRVERTFADLV
jgi:lipopolysaccharide transport system permease protein